MFTLRLRGNRDFDLENEVDVNRLGLHVLSLEDKLALALEQTNKLHQMLGEVLSRPEHPDTPMDMSPVTEGLQRILVELQSGHHRIVMAQLADTVIKRDPVTGDPERSVKIVA